MRSTVLLILAAAIWGFAFVAQRAGMAHIGPFAFNAVRFMLGALSLTPLFVISRNKTLLFSDDSKSPRNSSIFFPGLSAGVVLFMGSSLQQIGIVYTTAGKAGFITGLYLIYVPILGFFWRKRSQLNAWLGAVIAVIGLYLLSVTEQFTIGKGDFLVFTSAFFWAVHVQLIGWLSLKCNVLKLAFSQYLTCAVLSLIAALLWEEFSFQSIIAARIPILYGGIASVGIAYTLQVFGQRHAHPTNAAIILSLEAVFAALEGWLVLSETMAPRGLIGCALMLAGMLLSQIKIKPGWAGKMLKLKNRSTP